MIDPFSWLRRKAAEAIVSGVADGVKAVTPEGEQPPADLAELRAMLATAVQPKPLAAAKADAAEADAEPTKGKRGK
ncbi:hypothetical protein [Frigoriglobus tundricola]|uniref:Uncharacterized protein n=1 Tax=Frigoriglobus tundricola TaxID=2774151 RepID=A0A6M5Z798_9BACT|nr:hypothetical protein [Frigoriglobus tundricola]QJW93114.1 hypothetical protein FTUN_0617 [Frigoriglobus tundricola]QJX01231.1 hypothetical protein FTUN_8870 [Frigoriglobus tundricola]